MLEKIFVNEMKKICIPTAKAVVKVGQQIWRYKSEHEVPDYIEFDGVQATFTPFLKVVIKMTVMLHRKQYITI